MAKIPEVFRCHVTMRGEQCPCEMTLANTFTFKMQTLDRKEASSGNGKVAIKTLKKYALCPWHARYLINVGYRDIVRLDNVASLMERREKQARVIAAEKQALRQHNERLTNRNLAYMPRLGAALLTAGVTA